MNVNEIENLKDGQPIYHKRLKKSVYFRRLDDGSVGYTINSPRESLINICYCEPEAVEVRDEE